MKKSQKAKGRISHRVPRGFGLRFSSFLGYLGISSFPPVSYPLEIQVSGFPPLTVPDAPASFPMRKFSVLPLLSALFLAMPLSAELETEGTPLFAEGSLAGWLKGDGTPATPGGWTMEKGVLTRQAQAGDLWSVESYGDFDLSFEWQVTQGANSGVKYRVLKQGTAPLGFEYQVLDDAVHRDGKNAKTSAGALYHVIAPNDAKALKPVGEWNQARVVVRGKHIEHWLNGQKIVDVVTEGADWDAAVAKSKYSKTAAYGKSAAGPIVIQDHGDKVSFRNMVVKKL